MTEFGKGVLMNTLDPALRTTSQSRTNPATEIFRPTRPVSTGIKVLTLENAECGIRLRVGERFKLDLGNATWNLNVMDESVLTANGEGNFQAIAGGKTRIRAKSAPLNNSGPPGVKLYFEVPVVIQAD
jgi:hypothetical protein